MGRPLIQSEIPGFEDPTRDPDLDRVLFAWLDAKDEQKQAVATTTLKHSMLLFEIAERGHERYPYLDRSTGKKKYVVVEKKPRAKIIGAPGGGKRGRKSKDKSVEVLPPDESDGKVESRRRSRESVEAEIGPLDPFASTRAAMGGNLLDEAETVRDGDVDATPIAKPDRPAAKKKRGKKAKN